MEKVTGIGGIFFRANDPASLSAWYDRHLGINPVPTDMAGAPWISGEGVTVFAPFPAETDYFAADKAFMINLRVRDMDAMLAQLRAAGIEIESEQTMDGLGRFARLRRPRSPSRP